MQNHKITGIVLAGGKSSRMGSDKGLVKYKDKHLVEYSINAIKPYCSEIIISANSDEYLQFGYSVVKDIIPNKGPLSGIHAGLISSETDLNLVISCDMPHISSRVIETILKSISTNDLGVIPACNEKLEPMLGIYKQGLLPCIEQHLQDNLLKLNYFIRSNDIKVIDFKNEECEIFKNMNHPEDLES